MAKTVDWQRMRVEYVTGAMSYKALAKKHGVQANTLSKRGKDEKWPEERRKFRDEAAARAISGEVVNEAERLNKLIRAEDALEDVVLKLFQDAQQFYRHIVIDGNGVSSERMFEKVDTRAIKDLSGTLKDLTLVRRNLHGMPTQAEKESQRIAAERLNLDKRKAESGEESDKAIQVAFSGPGMEEYSE